MGKHIFRRNRDMPLGLPGKASRVLEDHTISRLGANEVIKVDVRGIYATKKSEGSHKESSLQRRPLFIE